MQQDHKQLKGPPEEGAGPRAHRAQGPSCAGGTEEDLHPGPAAHLLPEAGGLGGPTFYHRQALPGHPAFLSRGPLALLASDHQASKRMGLTTCPSVLPSGEKQLP